MLLVFLTAQTVLVPILGLLFLGIRNERLAKKRQLDSALRALRIVGISRGKHW